MKKAKILSALLILLALVFIKGEYDSHHRSDRYFRTVAAKSVAPAKLFSIVRGERRIGTTFQLAYKGWQYTITNNHICKAYDEYIIVGEEALKILYKDPVHDICVIESSSVLPYLKIAERRLEPTDDVYVIGFPRGMNKTVRSGYLINYGFSVFGWLKNKLTVQYGVISATAYPGNSGSPILNSKGEVVGILFAGQRGIHTEALIVPLLYLTKALDRFNAQR
tara:strand:- start:1057 stop:1722 length:666 start_codon:yes stop_codon:yes gene_type:complete